MNRPNDPVEDDEPEDDSLHLTAKPRVRTRDSHIDAIIDQTTRDLETEPHLSPRQVEQLEWLLKALTDETQQHTETTSSYGELEAQQDALRRVDPEVRLACMQRLLRDRQRGV